MRLKHLLLAAAAAAALPVLAAAPAMAGWEDLGNLVYSTDQTTIPAYSHITTMDLGAAAGGVNGFVSKDAFTYGSGASQVNVTYTGANSGIYHGTSTAATAPQLASGPDTRNYFAVGTGGTVRLDFASAQSYFGVLWGSVETYNVLTFYSGGDFVQQLTGTDISVTANTAQGSNGSYIINVNFAPGVTFDRVVASSSRPSFEFNQLSYSAQNVPLEGVPQPSAAPAPVVGATPVGGALGLGLLGLLGRGARRRRASSAAA